MNDNLTDAMNKMSSAVMQHCETEIRRRIMADEKLNDIEVISVHGCTCRGITNKTNPASDTYWCWWELRGDVEFVFMTQRGGRCPHMMAEIDRSAVISDADWNCC